MSDTVKDNPAKHRFEIVVEGITACAEYERKPGVVTFTHTVVPEALGGKGVGSKLAKGALDAVRAERSKLVPQCPFIAAYIKKHPEYQDLVVA
ncbi:MAG: GNAT family N-acetyltransferase [Parvibaculum sp.]|uniref:GNAT family N-acetyltransferase n=1 Tax=Parvibaculum sp. TaxID=2024848 RepID=UPI003C72C6C2